MYGVGRGEYEYEKENSSLWLNLHSQPKNPKEMNNGAWDNLEQHFQRSAFFDVSSCRHDYKLLGSKIFSSGRFQQQLYVDAEEAASSKYPPSEFQGSLALAPSKGSSGNLAKRRVDSALSLNSENDPWGWFEDVETDGHDDADPLQSQGSRRDEVAPDPEATHEPPPYVLTESLSTQRLWHQTAGRRPRQPSMEREIYERIWQENFQESAVDYTAPLGDTKKSGGGSDRRNHKQQRVLYRATSPFGSAVSKSFKCDKCGEISSIMVHIPKFQIVQAGSDVHAEYLIVVGLGAVTLGVWRRFREFKHLATKIASSEKRKQFHNALCSWHCLRTRQRWFRCLDKDYLILKCFLLERFLHDLVFESLSPDTVREFLGVL